MANKKGKKGGGGGKGPNTNNSKKPKNEVVHEHQHQARTIDTVRRMWESLSQQERVARLTIDIEALRQRAKEVEPMVEPLAAEVVVEGQLTSDLFVEPTLLEVVDEGLRRLKDKGTWKLWSWAPDEEFHDAAAFRTFITEKHIREELRCLLPRDDPKAPERPAEAAFRQRMVDLLQKLQPALRPAEELPPPGKPNRRRHAYDAGQASRTTNIDLISTMLEALSKEHDCLYQSLLQPLAAYIVEVLPEGSRKTAKTDLALKDLERLHPDQAACIVDWLTEKVDGLSTKLKADPKDDEPDEDEENMGDVDLWSLTEDGKSLVVNELWLQHLQDRLLGEDGHPRKVKPGEDPHHNGLVLEWVFGSIVSTAEKARDSAKRGLGTYVTTATDALAMLLRALEDCYIWETRGKQAKELMSEMLKSRLEAQELASQYGLQPIPRDVRPEDLPGDPGESALPNHVIVSMLQREVLLTKAKLHFLVFEHLQQDKAVRMLKVQLRQGEPEFERLKRELDEVKNQHRGLDGTYRSAAEMDRHRVQLADAAIEEQLEVQTAFREQGARLQGIYDKKQRAEVDMSKRENEIKQLQGWKGTVESLIEKFQDVLAIIGEPIVPAGTSKQTDKSSSQNDTEAGAAAALNTITLPSQHPDAAMAEDAAASGADDDLGSEQKALEQAAGHAAVAEVSPQHYMQLAKFRNHFLRDVRKQLYGDAEDKQFFESFKQEVKEVENRLEESRVALQHLEMAFINTACDDPGIPIGMQLALPMLQERLTQEGLAYAAECAKMAESEVIRMELEQQAREAAERERRLKAKKDKKDKARSEREKAAAEKTAELAAEQERKAQEAAKRLQQEEEQRKARLEQLEALRRAEEEYMEQRRKELLSDEGGYWRQRMEAEARVADAAVKASLMGDDDEASDEPIPATAANDTATSSSNEESGFVAYARQKRAREPDSNGRKPVHSTAKGAGLHDRHSRDSARDGKAPGGYGSAHTPGRRDQRDGQRLHHPQHARHQQTLSSPQPPPPPPPPHPRQAQVQAQQPQMQPGQAQPGQAGQAQQERPRQAQQQGQVVQQPQGGQAQLQVQELAQPQVQQQPQQREYVEQAHSAPALVQAGQPQATAVSTTGAQIGSAQQRPGDVPPASGVPQQPSCAQDPQAPTLTSPGPSLPSEIQQAVQLTTSSSLRPSAQPFVATPSPRSPASAAPVLSNAAAADAGAHATPRPTTSAAPVPITSQPLSPAAQPFVSAAATAMAAGRSSSQPLLISAHQAPGPAVGRQASVGSAAPMLVPGSAPCIEPGGPALAFGPMPTPALASVPGFIPGPIPGPSPAPASGSTPGQPQMVPQGATSAGPMPSQGPPLHRSSGTGAGQAPDRRSSSGVSAPHPADVPGAMPYPGGMLQHQAPPFVPGHHPGIPQGVPPGALPHGPNMAGPAPGMGGVGPSMQGPPENSLPQQHAGPLPQHHLPMPVPGQFHPHPHHPHPPHLPHPHGHLPPPDPHMPPHMAGPGMLSPGPMGPGPNGPLPHPMFIYPHPGTHPHPHPHPHGGLMVPPMQPGLMPPPHPGMVRVMMPGPYGPPPPMHMQLPPGHLQGPPQVVAGAASAPGQPTSPGAGTPAPVQSDTKPAPAAGPGTTGGKSTSTLSVGAKPFIPSAIRMVMAPVPKQGQQPLQHGRPKASTAAVLAPEAAGPAPNPAAAQPPAQRQPDGPQSPTQAAAGPTKVAVATPEDSIVSMAAGQGNVQGPASEDSLAGCYASLSPHNHLDAADADTSHEHSSSNSNCGDKAEGMHEDMKHSSCLLLRQGSASPPLEGHWNQVKSGSTSGVSGAAALADMASRTSSFVVAELVQDSGEESSGSSSSTARGPAERLAADPGAGVKVLPARRQHASRGTSKRTSA